MNTSTGAQTRVVAHTQYGTCGDVATVTSECDDQGERATAFSSDTSLDSGSLHNSTVSKPTTREQTPDGVPGLEPDDSDSSDSDNLSFSAGKPDGSVANENDSALAQLAAITQPRRLFDHNLTLNNVITASSAEDVVAPLQRWLSDESDALQYKLSHGGKKASHSAAMEMWLSDRDDYLHYKLSHGGRHEPVL